MPTVTVAVDDLELPEGVMVSHFIYDPELNPLALAADRALPNAHCETSGVHDLVLRVKGPQPRVAIQLPIEAQNWLSYWQGLRRQVEVDDKGKPVLDENRNTIPIPHEFDDPDGRDCQPITFDIEVPDWAVE
jgi:hypothetical protein